MSEKARMNVLGIYDLFLSAGAIITGMLMISSKYGIFVEYPKEWLSILPFKNWIVPGIIAIVVFGIGNMVAAIFSLKRKGNKPWLLSVIMGGVFLISMVLQVIILGESYLVTVQFFIFCIIQICISLYAYLGHRKAF